MRETYRSFLVALSAAVLLTGGLPGPAQSQGPEGGWSPTIDGVESQGDYSGYMKLPEGVAYRPLGDEYWGWIDSQNRLQSPDLPTPPDPWIDWRAWREDPTKNFFRDPVHIRNVIDSGYYEPGDWEADPNGSTFEDPNWTGFSSEPSSPRDLKLIRRVGWSPREVRQRFDDWTGGFMRRTLHLSGVGDGRKLLLDLAINPKTFDPFMSSRDRYAIKRDRGGPYIRFSSMEVGPDGSFSKTLEDGRSIAGKIPNLIDNLFDRRAIVATYSGLNGLKIYYNKYNSKYIGANQDEHAHIDSLRRLMFFDSQHYSEANYRENFALAESLVVKGIFGYHDNDDVKREHIERGKSLLGRDAGDLSVDLRLNADKITQAEEMGWTKGRGNGTWRYYYKRWQAHLKDREDRGLPLDHDFVPLKQRSRNAQNVSCEGVSCTGMLGQRKLEKLFRKDRFVPGPHWDNEKEEDVLEDVHTVLANQGIYLTLYDPSQGRGRSFGAWMDDAGFFVMTGGYVDRAEILFGAGSDSRTVAAVGERTGNRPAADATWRGSMVGTATSMR
ncbi:MAG: hypothetical protein GDA41_11630, partial [Rhodospirillales bacterium]|nr:hypothetical protein [Rhodospirillales bacterium]